MESYEQKYKEALERAKVIYQGSYKPDTAATIAETLQNVFPELKESEESKEWILKYLYYGLGKSDEQTKDQFETAINWLESLKDRVQPKQEWSEYDEDMRYKATAVINKLCAEGKEYVWSVNTLKQLFYWLKSLKDHVHPQTPWKPTASQMSQLKWIAHQNADNMIGKELMTLYEDLKKLTE